MSENDSIINNPLFGAIIGQKIGNKAHAEADRIRSKSEIDGLESSKNNAMMVVAFLKGQVESLSSSESGLSASLVGVRAVTRELLEELRKSDPNNPFLEKNTRDRVFMTVFNDAVKEFDVTPHMDRKNLQKSWTKKTFNAEGAKTGGPEKFDISPNLIVRAEAEVPSHISDREKFLGLIERLSAEVKKNNPNAEILKDKVMLEIFSGHPLE